MRESAAEAVVTPKQLSQAGILEPLPSHARYLTFQLRADAAPQTSLAKLATLPLFDRAVVGFGQALVSRLNATIDGLREPPTLEGRGVSVPVTPVAVWLWLRGEDPGDLVHQSRQVARCLEPAFTRHAQRDGFSYGGGRDLSGYEDGTENPTGDAAVRAGLVHDRGPGMDGSSFVATQTWLHDLRHFETLSPTERDHVIGRRLKDNVELSDAPPSAHVKRTAQEGFSPEAFVVRRSMPWADASGEGLNFVCFGHSLAAFEAQLRRMLGLDDGIVDGLFRLSRPLSTSYAWCPPAPGGHLDLSALGL